MNANERKSGWGLARIHRDRTAMKDWLALVRLPAVFSAWSNVLAAHLIVTAGSPHWRLLALTLGISTALYWAGMILNDCFDLPLDRRERPERPLPAGRIRPAAAWAAGGGLVLAALLLALAAGGQVPWVTLALAAAVLLYDGWLKAGAFGPLAMGSCRYLNWMLGLAVVPILGTELVLPLPVLLYTLAVTWLSRGETGRDMQSAVARAGLGLAAAALAVGGLHAAGVQTQPLALAALAGLVAPLALHLRRLHGAPTAEGLRRGVGLMLLAMIPLDAVLLAGDGQWTVALGLLVLAVPGRLLGRRLAVT